MSDTLTNRVDDEANRPWYRQPWLWFLILFPAMSITYCIIAITISLNTHTSMVVDDYSKEGLAINASLAREAMAADLGLQAQVRQTGREMEIVLDSHQAAAVSPDYLILKLFHPTMGEQDRTIQLRKISPGVYQGQVAGTINGRWYLDLSGPDNDWRIKGEGHFPSEAGVMMRPEDADRG